MWEMWHGRQAFIENSPLPPDTKLEEFLSYVTKEKRPTLDNIAGKTNSIIEGIIGDSWKGEPKDRSTVHDTLIRLQAVRSDDYKVDRSAQTIK